MTQPESTKPKRLDSLGRVTEPLAMHLWEKSWQEKPAVIEEEFCIIHTCLNNRKEYIDAI